MSTRHLVQLVSKCREDPNFASHLAVVDAAVIQRLWAAIHTSNGIADQLAAASKECIGNPPTVQSCMFALSEFILSELGANTQLAVRDTHLSNAPRDQDHVEHKIDLTFVPRASLSALAGRPVPSGEVVTFAELKMDLNNTGRGESAWEQILARVAMILTSQLDRRNVLCCASDKTAIRFFFYHLDDPATLTGGIWRSTAMLPFVTQTVGDGPTLGFSLWVRFLATPLEALGFPAHPTLPSVHDLRPMLQLADAEKISVGAIRFGGKRKATVFSVQTATTDYVGKLFQESQAQEFSRERAIYSIISECKPGAWDNPFPALVCESLPSRVLLVRDYGVPVLDRSRRAVLAGTARHGC